MEPTSLVLSLGLIIAICYLFCMILKRVVDPHTFRNILYLSKIICILLGVLLLIAAISIISQKVGG
jgi:hypothetical protein